VNLVCGGKPEASLQSSRRECWLLGASCRARVRLGVHR
jgi:hypothetical protein